HVDLGVLLCWFHHDLVHQRGIQITRHKGSWIFTRHNGHVIVPPGTDPPLASYHDPANIDTTFGVGQVTPHENLPPLPRSSGRNQSAKTAPTRHDPATT